MDIKLGAFVAVSYTLFNIHLCCLNAWGMYIPDPALVAGGYAITYRTSESVFGYGKRCNDESNQFRSI